MIPSKPPGIHLRLFDKEFEKCCLVRDTSLSVAQKVYYKTSFQPHGLTVEFSFHIEEDLTWKCYVLNTLLDASSEVLKELPTYISDNNISQFVLKFNELNFFEGKN